MFQSNIIKIIILIIILFIINIFVEKYLYSFNGKILIDKIKNPEYNLGNKKIAICFSGQVRSGYEECFMLYQIFLINTLNADVFCCFEDCNDNIKMFINNKLKPIKVKYVSDYIKNNDIVVSLGTLSMYNKIYLCNELKKEYEKQNNFTYDYVIRIRPDLIIKEYLPKYIFENDSNKLYLPIISNIFDSWGYPDFMAIGNSKLMDIYSNIFIYLSTNSSNKCNISETLLLKYLSSENVNCDVINIPLMLYRFKYDNINNIIESGKYIISLLDRYVFKNTC